MCMPFHTSSAAHYCSNHARLRMIVLTDHNFDYKGQPPGRGNISLRDKARFFFSRKPQANNTNAKLANNEVPSRFDRIKKKHMEKHIHEEQTTWQKNQKSMQPPALTYLPWSLSTAVSHRPFFWISVALKEVWSSPPCHCPCPRRHFLTPQRFPPSCHSFRHCPISRYRFHLSSTSTLNYFLTSISPTPTPSASLGASSSVCPSRAAAAHQGDASSAKVGCRRCQSATAERSTMDAGARTPTTTRRRRRRRCCESEIARDDSYGDGRDRVEGVWDCELYTRKITEKKNR